MALLLTPEHLFLRANAAMCRLLGRTEAELIGRAAEDLAHPDDRASILAALDDARSGVLRGFRIWARAIRADGAVIPMLVAITMLFDEVETRLAVRTEAAVYKIVEEALTNVMRHASHDATASRPSGGGQ